MDEFRHLLQLMTRRFGMLNENCCSIGTHQVSLVQSQILYEIDRQSRASMQQIASTLGMETTRFSHQIRTLIKQGLVAKSASESDKRVFLLTLTAAGKFVVTTIEQRIQTNLALIISRLTEEQQATVVESLKLLNRSMEETPACCSC